MPKIIWPEQPSRIAAACARHALAVPADVSALLARAAPPSMTAVVARAFLRCFYAARDLERTERDQRGGGPQTEAFAQQALGRRVSELRRHLAALAAALGSDDLTSGQPAP